MAERGKYIVLEGGEYVGKSTQAGILAEAIQAQLVREPGTTTIGEEIRRVILNNNLPRIPQTDVLLHAAQRATLLRTVVEPVITNGRHVVSDRSWISSAAYQGASGIPLEDIEAVNRFAIGSYMTPDLLIVLDAAPEAVASRRTDETDYYESMDLEFHSRLRNNFIELAGIVGGVVIQATQDRETVTRQIRETVRQELGL